MRSAQGAGLQQSSKPPPSPAVGDRYQVPGFRRRHPADPTLAPAGGIHQSPGPDIGSRKVPRTSQLSLEGATVPA
nr:hypothetical protein GCM10017547_15350 [Pseudarthrobacter oxydans]